MKKCPDWEI